MTYGQGVKNKFAKKKSRFDGAERSVRVCAPPHDSLKMRYFAKKENDVLFLYLKEKGRKRSKQA